jgi:hypothetical protein
VRKSHASFARYVHELASDAIAGKLDPLAVLEHLKRESAKALAKKNPSDPVFTAEQIARAKRDYRWKHWGLKGNGKVSPMTCADPAHEPLTEMGRLVSVTYETDKLGDPSGTHYEHDFSRPLPVLAYSVGGLVICGGRYRVEARGIID